MLKDCVVVEAIDEGMLHCVQLTTAGTKNRGGDSKQGTSTSNDSLPEDGK